MFSVKRRKQPYDLSLPTSTQNLGPSKTADGGFQEIRKKYLESVVERYAWEALAFSITRSTNF